MNQPADNLMTKGFFFNDAYAQRWEASGQKAHMAAIACFTSALYAGTDEQMPSIHTSGNRYRLSTYLGECSGEAQALLFLACHYAAKGDHAEAGRRLAVFTAKVAAEYADDHMEAFQ